MREKSSTCWINNIQWETAFKTINSVDRITTEQKTSEKTFIKHLTEEVTGKEKWGEGERINLTQEFQSVCK